MSQRELYIVEGLICNCTNNKDYDHINELIALKRFADATGSALYLGKQDDRLLKCLAEYDNFLPGGKYQPGYTHAAKVFMDDLIDETTLPLTRNQGTYFSCHEGDSPNREKYFICKNCCPVCRNSSRGCPLHCCTLCWEYLHKLDTVSKLYTFKFRSVSVKKAAITDLVSTINKDATIPNSAKLRHNKGYIHNSLDVAVYLYTLYDINYEVCKSIVSILETNH